MKLGFNEIKEGSLKLASCALGKTLEHTNVGKAVFLGEKALAIAIDMKKCCPIENGEWRGDEESQSGVQIKIIFLKRLTLKLKLGKRF